MERYRHAEREVKQAVSEGRISREEAGRKLREIKGQLWGDEPEKDRSREKEDPGHDLRQAEGRIHEDIGKVQEAIVKGEISPEEARKKLIEFHERQKKASREREWKMIKGRIEGAVREGKMSREQANEEYERIERRMHSRDKIAREINERVRKAELEIHERLEAGEISHEEARQSIREVHEEMHQVVRLKHLALELEDHKRRIERALESGDISKRQAEQKMIEVRQRLARQFRVDLGDEQPKVRKGSDEREGRKDRLRHEDERELWDALKRGLDAAVKLGKIDEEESREIWEDFRNEDEEGDEEAFEEDEPE
tara:strand:+ start:19088 stop:20023 length:936 start_codon:yes stop_codon:yes gene_type:complete